MSLISQETLINLYNQFETLNINVDFYLVWDKLIKELLDEMDPIIHFFMYTHDSHARTTQSLDLARKLRLYLKYWCYNKPRLTSALCSVNYMRDIKCNILQLLRPLINNIIDLASNPPFVYPNRRSSDIVL